MPICNCNDVKLSYDVRGKGPVLLFVHPPLVTSTAFLEQVDGLSESFTVVTFDIRGNGNSSASKSPVTLSVIANDLKELLNYLQIEKAYFCGYSLGSSVILEFLLKYPNRASGAILIGAFSAVHDPRLHVRLSLATKLARFGACDLLAYAVARSHATNRISFTQLLREARRSTPANIAEYYESGHKHAFTEHLKDISHPILLVYGARDKSFHPYANELRLLLPHNELHFILGTKHQIPQKAPDDLNDLVRNFIQNLEKAL